MYDRKEMFKATCSDCGDSCEVPFKPTGSKPVLCSSCFGQQSGGRSGGRDRGDRGNRRSFDRGGRSGGRDRGDREMHKVVCDKCGNDCEVPFKPTAGKPIYCNDCFGKNSDRGDRHGGRDKRGGGGGQSSQQFDSLNQKLDRIISLLEAGSVKKESPKKESAVTSVLKKPATTKKVATKAAKKPATKKKTTKKKK